MISLNEIEKAYHAHSRELAAFVSNYASSQEEIEDIIQDVFIKLITYSKKKDVDCKNIRALLYTIARTVSLDKIRKIKRSRESSSDDETLEQYADPHSLDNKNDSLTECLDAFIESMKEPEKTIILLRKNGLTFAEIGAITGIPERTLKRKTKLALELIHAELKNEGFIQADGMKNQDETLY